MEGRLYHRMTLHLRCTNVVMENTKCRILDDTSIKQEHRLNTKLPMTKWLLCNVFVQADKVVFLHVNQLGYQRFSKSACLDAYEDQRVCCKANANNSKLSGEVEIDKLFVGGKNKNRHKDKQRNVRDAAIKIKVPVFGILERGGN